MKVSAFKKLIKQSVQEVFKEEIEPLHKEIKLLNEEIQNLKKPLPIKENSEVKKTPIKKKYNEYSNYTKNSILNGLLNETSPLEENDVNSVLDNNNGGLEEVFNRDYSDLMKAMKLVD